MKHIFQDHTGAGIVPASIIQTRKPHNSQDIEEISQKSFVSVEKNIQRLNVDPIQQSFTKKDLKTSQYFQTTVSQIKSQSIYRLIKISSTQQDKICNV